MSERAKENICKKDTGRLAVPEPSLPTFDAFKHRDEIIANREARNMAYSSPIVSTPEEVYTPSKSDSNATGMKAEQSVDDEYAIAEPKEWVKKKAGKAGSDTVEEINRAH